MVELRAIAYLTRARVVILLALTVCACGGKVQDAPVTGSPDASSPAVDSSTVASAGNPDGGFYWVEGGFVTGDPLPIGNARGSVDGMKFEQRDAIVSTFRDPRFRFNGVASFVRIVDFRDGCGALSNNGGVSTSRQLTIGFATNDQGGNAGSAFSGMFRVAGASVGPGDLGESVAQAFFDEFDDRCIVTKSIEAVDGAVLGAGMVSGQVNGFYWLRFPNGDTLEGELYSKFCPTWLPASPPVSVCH